MTNVRLRRGDGPLLISAPHVGVTVPDDIAARLTDAGRALVDTDWEVERLYPFAEDLRATTLTAVWSRYVVDVNRDPDGTSLYPGARTTGLCPTETFEGEPIYRAGAEPGDAEVAERRTRYWEPYHAVLREELDRIRARHGYALLVDAHSIWGRLPLLFEGELPAVNLGTNSGRACLPAAIDAVVAAVAPSPYDIVVDGRFKGGYITRHYGVPHAGVQALQIELNQRAYLAEDSRTAWDPPKAARLSAVLRAVCEAYLGSGVPPTTTPVQRLEPSQ